METKMKGLLKGLRYISQIFDSTKEAEMQIGYPTDVKHVAHIGWDSQATNNNPSWMNDLKAGEPSPRSSSGRELTQDKQPTRPPRRTSSGDTASPKHDMSPSSRQTHRRHSASSSAGGYYNDSSSQEPNDGSGRNRKNCTITATFGDPPHQDAPAVPKKNRKNCTITATFGDPPHQDAPAVPKQNRRRKTKVSSGGGSAKSKSKSTTPAQEFEADDEREPAMTGIGAVRPQMITGTGEGSF